MEKKIASLEKKSGGEEEVVVVEEKEEEEEKVVLPGFRFHPTDEELIGFYLRRKVDNKHISIEIIKEMDIYKYDPWDLPKVSSVAGGEKEWYFFCLRGRKYRNSIRPNRVTGSGFWKATGIDRPICSASDANDCIGLKKSLVYYRGSAGKGTKTDWMMHEFRLPSNNNETCSPSMQEAEIWTICRIFKRNVPCKKYTQGSLKQSPRKQTHPADSSSKSTSSLDSDAGDEYRNLGCVNVQQSDRLLTNCFEGMNQVFGGQWNPAAQAPFATTLHPSVAQNLNTNEFLKEGNWDELGRIIEYHTMDPSATQECRYY